MLDAGLLAPSSRPWMPTYAQDDEQAVGQGLAGRAPQVPPTQPRLISTETLEDLLCAARIVGPREVVTDGCIRLLVAPCTAQAVRERSGHTDPRRGPIYLQIDARQHATGAGKALADLAAALAAQLSGRAWTLPSMAQITASQMARWTISIDADGLCSVFPTWTVKPRLSVASADARQLDRMIDILAKQWRLSCMQAGAPTA